MPENVKELEQIVKFLELNGAKLLEMRYDGYSYDLHGFGIDIDHIGETITFIGETGDFADIKLCYYTLVGFLICHRMIHSGFIHVTKEMVIKQ